MSRYWDDKENDPRMGLVFRDLAIGLVIIIAAGMAGCPPYSVWTKTLEGKAELKKAEWDRQILIEAAKAKEIAASSWARAEVARAKGANEANIILQKSLGGKEAYLRWLFIEKLDEIQGQIIYLPTEAGMPILEAGKR